MTRSGTANVEVEIDLVVCDVPGPNPAVDDLEFMRLQGPERHAADHLGKVVGFLRKGRLASHLVDKSQGTGMVAVAAQLAAIGILPVSFGPARSHVRRSGWDLRVYRLVQQHVGFGQQPRHDRPAFRVGLGPFQDGLLPGFVEQQVGMLQLLKGNSLLDRGWGKILSRKEGGKKGSKQ